jgi:hypothetical protein
MTQGVVRHHLGQDEASSGKLNHDASNEPTRGTKRRNTDRWRQRRIGGVVPHLNSWHCNMYVDCGYVLWRVELAVGMRKFEHFGSKVYLFGSRWAFGAVFGGRGWEITASHTESSATAPKRPQNCLR